MEIIEFVEAMQDARTTAGSTTPVALLESCGEFARGISPLTATRQVRTDV
jgi:hypothetical protein